MADILNTSVSGLLAFQHALDTTSQNVANVATPGYSRQQVQFTELTPQPTANGWIGSGVQIGTITRSYDEALAQQVRSSQSSYSSFNTFSTQAAQLASLLSDSGTGISATLQNFSNALQGVANSPASTPQRQVLLSQAQSLVQQLQSYDGQLNQYSANVESQIQSGVSQINTLTSGIASLNKQIAAGLAGTGQPPNDLMDQRDHLVDQLSQYVNVNTVVQSDGQMNVYIGSGQAVVLAGTSQQLTTTTDSFDPTRHEISVTNGTSSSDVTSEINGGSLGGQLQLRSQLLDPARNAIGRVSVGLAAVVNQQQAAGMDLSGNLGQAMFAVGAVQTLASQKNTGTGSLSVTRSSNLSALTNDDYVLQNTGSGWQLTDSTTGTAVALQGAGTAANPFTAAGLSIVVNGAPAAGDRYLIKPTAQATAGLSVLLTSPTQIAAAAPIRTAGSSANTGSASISAGTVVDATNPQLRSTTTIQFLSPNSYSVNGGPAVAYTSGSPITLNGWQMAITGSPAAGDTFTVSNNSGGTGDNRNALAMIDALSSPVLDGGTTSLADAGNNLVSQVGVQTQQAQANSSAQQAVYQDAVNARNNFSGVNLDEEAANLVRYQQAYQAAAQVIQVSNTLFNSLMAAFGR
jgi:flagellar hook-associated protein 1 FlgK